jgi:tape measure domain-containing protein
MATAAGSVIFDIGISRNSITAALQQVQTAFARSGIGINNLSFTPQALSNIKSQVERALGNVKINAPVTAPRPTGGSGSVPSQSPQTQKANQDLLVSLRAQKAAAEAVLAVDSQQAEILRKQAATLNEALRFKRQLAQIKNAGLDPKSLKDAEQFARQISQLNKKRINITPQINGKPAIAGANRLGDIVTGIFQGVGQQITQLITQALAGAIGAVTQFGQASLSAANQTRAINATLQTSLGSAEAAAESYKFARDTLDALGASIQTGVQQYASLTAAAQSAGIQQQLSNDFFASFSQVLVQNGVALEAQNRAFVAASQIFAKNTLSAEELRGQLAEALPSAIGIVAKGLQQIGVSASGSTEELQKLLESGSINAEQFAQAWIAGAGAVQGAIDPLNQSIGQAQNKIFEFSQSVGKSLEPLQQTTLNAFSAGLDVISNSKVFDILNKGITDFIKQLNSADDILTPIKLLLTEITEQLTGVLVSAFLEFGDAIKALSANDIENIKEQTSAFLNIISAAISTVSEFSQIFFFVINLLDEFRNLVKNIPLFGNIFAAALNPVKSLSESIDELNDKIKFLKLLFTDPFEAFSFAIDSTSAEKGFDKIAELAKKTAIASTDSFNQSAKAREAANKKAIKAFERDTQNAERAIEQSQQESIARIKQLQASGQITAEDADIQIKLIESNTDAAIAAKETEIAKIKQLQQQGVITAEDAGERISKAQLEKSKLIIQGLDAEIDAQKAAADAAEEAAERAKKAALDSLNAQSARAQELSNIRQQQLDIASSAISQQSALLNEQQKLASSINALEEQRLTSALETARAEKDITGAQTAAQDLAQTRQRAIENEFSFKEKSFQLTQTQNRLEAQRQIAITEIAAIEARIALQKAETEGATAEEVANLRTLISLADQQVQGARDNLANTDRINSLLADQLGVERQLADEKLKQVDAVNELKKAEEDLANRQRALADEQINQAQRIADARAGAISSVFNAISQEANKSAEEGIASLKSAADRLKVAQQAGFFGSDEGRAGATAASKAIRDVQQLLARGDDRQLATAAFRASQGEDGGAAFADALQLAGRGDIASLIDADQSFADVTTAIQDAQTAIADKLEEVRKAILERDVAVALSNRPNVDTQINPSALAATAATAAESRTAQLTQRSVQDQLASQGISVASLTVSTPDPVADTAAILGDFQKQSTRGRR